MKHLLLIAISIGITASAHAGNMKFTCKNADSSIVITRDSLVLLETDSATKQSELTILNNLTVNTMPDKNEVIHFSKLNNNQKIGELKITNISDKKIIAEDSGGECKDGHTPGFSTDSYEVQGQISLFNNKKVSINLSCIESAYWSGNCNFDGE